MENNDIKSKIKEVISKCSSQPTIYSNIIKEFFIRGIDKKSPTLEYLKILPELKEKDLQKKFKDNKQKICDFINNQEFEGLEFYGVLSCIFGAFVGDAVGGFCEFLKCSKNNYKKIFRDVPVFGQLKGQITDDSEMAMCLAYAIMDNPEKENLNPNYIYFYYGSWARSNPIDMGRTTEKAFKKFDFNTFNPKNGNFKYIQDEIFASNHDSLSNGFLMRKSTLIAWIYYRFMGEIRNAFKDINNNQALLKLYEKVKDFSNIDNQCTHIGLECDSASAFYIIMALGAIHGLRSSNIIDKIYNLCKDEYFAQKNDEETKVARNITFYIDAFKNPQFSFEDNFENPNSYYTVNKRIGWYDHSFKLILYYLVNFEIMEEKDKFKTILHQICNLGGDTDTNACIVGGIIGPLIGFKNFGDYFDKVLDVIPHNRSLFSICIMVLYVQYLKKSNRNTDLIKNDHVFLETILTLLYDDIEIDYS
jgi:ADP-ribosylglycohydrolase